ncbi:hypothetical protein TYRP_009542 [Tyrophagus putrescentiae]|nr:hypothetical protein TYRP_009542 [Tyrophagus putrescentiae]
MLAWAALSRYTNDWASSRKMMSYSKRKIREPADRATMVVVVQFSFDGRQPAPKKYTIYGGRGNVSCFAFIYTALSLVEAAGHL